jgi:serine/threonine-protein kinase
VVAAGTPSSREHDLQALVGAIVSSRYRVERLLGAGGMGAVYAGEHLTTGRKVALKFVDREFAENELARARFAREVRAMSAIQSEHIPGVLDAGTHDDGRPFLVMDLLIGEDLGGRLHREGRIPWREACAIVAQILRGLGHAHASGVIHRDLKPDNVFLVQGARGVLIKILDFGVSKFQPLTRTTLPLALTARGVVLGTPFYIAPEQARSEDDVDVRADLYSVGAILFECIAGRPPHVGERYEQVILSACTTDAPHLRSIEKTVPDSVDRLVSKALARDRTQRWQTAREMLAALAEIVPKAADKSASLRPSRPSHPSRPPSHMRMLATGLGAAFLGAAIALVVFAKLQPKPEPITHSPTTPTASITPNASTTVVLVALSASSAAPMVSAPKSAPTPSKLELQRTFP